jgi:uncharacterized membrane protein (UPF0136 family)
MNLAASYFILFGTIAELLGLVAWLRVKSKVSLIAGLVSGLLLTIAGLLGLIGFPRPALVMGSVVSLLLLGRFLPGFLKKKSIYPDGLMAALSIIGIVLAGVYWR